MPPNPLDNLTFQDGYDWAHLTGSALDPEHPDQGDAAELLVDAAIESGPTTPALHKALRTWQGKEGQA